MEGKNILYMAALEKAKKKSDSICYLNAVE
jgi:hypothetical protein